MVSVFLLSSNVFSSLRDVDGARYFPSLFHLVNPAYNIFRHQLGTVVSSPVLTRFSPKHLLLLPPFVGKARLIQLSDDVGFFFEMGTPSRRIDWLIAGVPSQANERWVRDLTPPETSEFIFDF